MNSSNNATFVTPALKVTTDTSTGETVVTSPVAPGKEWRNESEEIAILRSRQELEALHKSGNLGSTPKWVEEFKAKPKGSGWND